MNIFTDEDIKEIVGPWGDTPIKGYTRSLFDRIEAKLREKQEVNTLRDAAQQALGALYIAQDDCVHGEMAEPSPIFEDAITALETALAESKSDTSSDYERGFIDGMQKQMQSSVDKAVNRMAALAEPEPTNQLPPMPEPVAWQVIDRLGKERNAPLFAEWQMRSYAQVAIDLAAPPQRQPLSDTNILEGWRSATAVNLPFSQVALSFARWLEAMHGIGGDK